MFHLLSIRRRGQLMPTRTEVLCDWTIGGENALSVARRFEPLHLPLSLAGGLVGVLRTIIQIPMLLMFHFQKDFALGGTISLQFIGNDDSWHIR